MFELICIAYAVAYALPLFTLEHSIIIKSQTVQITWPTASRALQLSILGALAMIVGYYTVIKAGGNRRWRIDLPITVQQTHRLSAVALIVCTWITLPGTLYTLRSFSSFGNSLANTLQMFVLAAIAKLAEDVFEAGTRKPFLKAVLILLVAMTCLSGLLVGMLEAAMTPILCVGILYWLGKRRFPWATVFSLCVALVVLNESKHAYRQETWVTDRSFTIEEKIGIWTKALSATILQKTNPEAREFSVSAEGRIIARMDLLHTFAYVIDTTPEVLPHYWGQSYSYIFIGWIPRLFWPNKPMAAGSNNLLAVDYELLSEAQVESTMTGIGLVAEAYANFGAVGCMAILVLFGAFLALVGNCFNGPNSDCGKAIYLSVMVGFLNGIGSSVTQLFYFVILNAILLVVLFRLFATSFQLRKVTSGLVDQCTTGRVAVQR